MPRPIYARLDLSALENNLGVARRTTSARIMSVIKADGYGHGLLRAADALSKTDGYALLDIRDAVKLREAGFRQIILLLEGFFSSEDLPVIAEYNLTCVIHNTEQINLLEGYPGRGSLDVWLKVNSGMNRLGSAPEQMGQAIERLKHNRVVRDITLMTHFANADDARGVSAPLALFNDLAAPYRVARSLANSAALLRYPEPHGDWVRPGIMLYGASPTAASPAARLDLRPVMTLRSELIAVTARRKGDAVGYGGDWICPQDMTIGVAAIGYGDGYPRHAPTGTPVLVNGQRAALAGRVSMDMLCIDLRAQPDACVGDAVTLWGDGLPVEDIATAAGTISYELLCGVSSRVHYTCL